MAMILRLQREKAEIELEARQNRSMVEEKTAHDEKEMDILKKIIVRRERKNHVLEKELNAYRQMMLDGGEQQSDTDLHDMTQLIMALKPGSSSDPLVDPMLVLQQFYGPAEKKEGANSTMQQVEDTESLVGERPNCTTALGNEWLARNNGGYSNHGYVKQDDSIKWHHEEMLDSGGGQNIEFKEKSMVTLMHQVASHLADEDGERTREIEIGLPSRQLEKENDQSSGDQLETEICVHDVHVIDDKTLMGDKRNIIKDDNKNEIYRTKSADRSTSNKVIGGNAAKINIRRSCSDLAKMGKFTGGLAEKASCFPGRHSMSAVEGERFILYTRK